MCRAPRSLAAILFAFVPAVASAQVTLVPGQTACNSGSSVASITATLPAPTTPGNSVVCVSGTFTTSRTVSSCADSNAGDVGATTIADFTDGSAPFSRSHVLVYPVTTGAAAQTVTYSGALSGAGYVCVAEYAGLNSAAYLVDTAITSNLTSTTSFSSGTLTTTTANALLVGTFLVTGALTAVADGTFTTLDRAADRYFAYRIVAATGGYAFTPTTGSSASGQTILASIAGTAGGGGGGGTARGALTRILP